MHALFVLMQAFKYLIFNSCRVCCSFSADTVAAVNSMQNFVLSVFPKPLLSYSHNRSDAVDIAEYMINVQDLNRQQRMGATDQPSSKPLDLTNLDAVLLVVSIRGDSAPAKGNVILKS